MKKCLVMLSLGFYLMMSIQAYSNNHKPGLFNNATWIQLSSYDTAKECEFAKKQMSPFDEYELCIASDDPRLAK